MKAGLVLAAVLCTGAVFAAPGTVRLLPPRSRLAAEVVVLRPGYGELCRISHPEVRQLQFACSYVQGATEHLAIDVTRQGGGEPSYRDCTPEEALRLAAAGSGEAVRVSDALVEAYLAGEAGGLRAAPGERFRTAAGLDCLLPVQRPAVAAVVRSARRGDRLTVRGRLLQGSVGRPAILVDAVQFEDFSGPPDEVPWAVAVQWAGREAGRLDAPGDCPLLLPCTQRQGALERLVVSLREFRMVDLDVGGHRVAAELADTDEARSYGLQGRSGLEPDHGMLFFFPEPLRPVMVMKTVSFPLSIAFISADGAIVNIVDLRPADSRRATSPVDVSYVLEMAQGWFREHEVSAGTRVVFP